jgi:hypothetical protein
MTWRMKVGRTKMEMRLLRMKVGRTKMEMRLLRMTPEMAPPNGSKLMMR